MDYTDKTGAGQTVIFSDDLNFDHILNDACVRLWNKKAELSIKKIRALDAVLFKIEQELSDFLSPDGTSPDVPSEDAKSAESIAVKGKDD